MPAKRMGVPTPAHRWQSLPVNPLVYGALVLLVFFGTIQAAQLAGWWATTGRARPDGSPVQLTGTNPAEIKGWMTLDAVVQSYQVPPEELFERFGIPADIPLSTPLKDLETIAPGFSVAELRAWLAERTAP